jgi:asparagine synthase (glutamine-hydrolysing)
MDEATLAAHFADAAYHSEQHNSDLNSVGKFCLSMLPREEGIKVVLTGEGSDEHFGGYPFFTGDFLREPDFAMPESDLSKNAEMRQKMQEKGLRELQASVGGRGGGTFLSGMADCEAFRAVNNVRTLGWAQMWHPTMHIFAPWVRGKWAESDPRLALTNEVSPEAKEKMLTTWHPLHSAQYLWTRVLLANNLLTCLGDRTEMAHSIESRPPFLDHELSEYVNNLPPSVKVAFTPDKEASVSGLPWENDKNTTASLFTEKCK